MALSMLCLQEFSPKQSMKPCPPFILRVSLDPNVNGIGSFLPDQMLPSEAHFIWLDFHDIWEVVGVR